MKSNDSHHLKPNPHQARATGTHDQVRGFQVLTLSNPGKSEQGVHPLISKCYSNHEPIFDYFCCFSVSFISVIIMLVMSIQA